METQKPFDAEKRETLRYYEGLFAPFENEPMRDCLSIIATGDDRGEALKTLKNIKKGSVVFAFRGNPVGKQSLHTLQIAPGRYIEDPLVMGKVLHSCEPNMVCDMSNQTFIALRDIALGELLTMDYESTEDVLTQSFSCECSEKGCRGEIRGRSLMSPSVTDSYKRIVVNGFRFYGKHLVFSGSGCNEKLLSKGMVAQFLLELAKRIDMVPFGEPLVERFGDGIELGISGVQLIETSAIVIHTNDGARDMYLDVFSCKDFNPDDVVDFVHSTFSPDRIQCQTLLRQ